MSVAKVTLLSLGRIGVGVAAVARPGLLGQALGADPAANAQLTYLLRLFGAREVALGAVTLVSSGSGRRNALLAGIAVDAADAGTGLLGIRDRDVPRVQGSVLAATAAGAVVTGLAGLVETRRDTRSVARATLEDAATSTGRSARRKARKARRTAARKASKVAAKSTKGRSALAA